MNVIYTISVIPTKDPSRNHSLSPRCIGWFPTLEEAKKAVLENALDMFESGHYQYAVIETIGSGIYPDSEPEYWFEAKYPVERVLASYMTPPTIVEIPKPTKYDRCCNFGIG